MKKNKNDQILLSPTDLKNFTQCKYLTKNIEHIDEQIRNLKEMVVSK